MIEPESVDEGITSSDVQKQASSITMLHNATTGAYFYRGPLRLDCSLQVATLLAWQLALHAGGDT
jgi:hypothetical protein